MANNLRIHRLELNTTGSAGNSLRVHRVEASIQLNSLRVHRVEVLSVYNAPYVYDGGFWKPVSVYIYNTGSWQKVSS